MLFLNGSYQTSKSTHLNDSLVLIYDRLYYSCGRLKQSSKIDLPEVVTLEFYKSFSSDDKAQKCGFNLAEAK